MRALLMTAGVAALVAGSFAVAAPKPPTTNAFVPEIAYSYLSGNSIDLRLANRDGSKAILVHRDSGTIIFDLAPSTQTQIAFAVTQDLRRKHWTSINGVVSLGGTELLFHTPGGWIQAVDYAPTEPRLLFTTAGFGDNAIRILNVSGQTAALERTFNVATAYQARWSPDGSEIVFQGRPTGADAMGFYRFDPDAVGEPVYTPFASAGPGTVYLDSTRPTASVLEPGFVATYGTELRHLNLGGSAERSFAGSEGHYDCTNSYVIHKLDDGRRSTTVIRPAQGGAPVNWSTDSNVRRTDWIPC